MNVVQWLRSREVHWRRLDAMCEMMEVRGRLSPTLPDPANDAGDVGAIVDDPEVESSANTTRRHTPRDPSLDFADLYRATCADLALADAYRLPPATVHYLNQLVGRAHNQLYRSRPFDWRSWGRVFAYDTPRRVFADPCVRLAAIVFYGLFALSLILARDDRTMADFPRRVVGTDQLEQMEQMYEEPLAASLSQTGALNHYVSMAGFYIKHNTGIGLVCFGLGVLIVPCLFKLAFNAVTLGTVFGYMGRDGTVGSENFLEFVTAHGPFELTAIVLSAAAGLKLGVGLFFTRGLSRGESLRRSATDSLPVIAAAVVLFVLAAFTEGFLSPGPLPYLVKAAWAIVSSFAIAVYFVVLGFPRDELDRLLAAPRASRDR